MLRHILTSHLIANSAAVLRTPLLPLSHPGFLISLPVAKCRISPPVANSVVLRRTVHLLPRSSEGKSILKDKLSEVATSLLAAYDNGDLSSALEEGNAGWQKWMKSFRKSLKRKAFLLSQWQFVANPSLAEVMSILYSLNLIFSPTRNIPSPHPMHNSDIESQYLTELLAKSGKS